MKRHLLLLASVVWCPAVLLAGERLTPSEAFTEAAEKLAAIVEPKAGTPPQTFSTRLHVVRAPMKEAVGREATIAYQWPDKLILSAQIDDSAYAAGRDGGQIWFHVSGKKWGVVGKPGVPRFTANPASIDDTVLPPFTLPERQKLALLPTLCNFAEQPGETVDGQACRVITATPTIATRLAFKLPKVHVQLAIAETGLPARVAVKDEDQLDVVVELLGTKLETPWTAEKWKIPARAGDRIETTAVSHFVRGITAGIAQLQSKLPTLPPVDGSRVLLATEGQGRLELHDHVRVLFLSGTPEDMGRQQGTLVKNEVHVLVDRILYGVGVMSSLAKGRWFFGEIEEAQSRLQKFMDPRYLRETDAMADAAGLTHEELRLANYFPELFHCSGFALMGPATEGGHLYHGRVLDYLKGVGLEQNACVTIVKPDAGNAWVNVGYCGFIGSVTAMNEKGLSIGEMGGRGEGHWDGKPMAQLVREVMEKASTLDEAVDLMRRSPRTCEYYYVITDAKAKRAVGVKATPDLFEVVAAGGSHPQLPEAVEGCVLMSAGDRYRELVRRTKAGFGHFTPESARALMTRPVCMTSNIHSVLFAPETLDFWVANADGQNVASATEYRHFNLGELLKAPPAKETARR
jgi:hypothetical protein